MPNDLALDAMVAGIDASLRELAMTYFHEYTNKRGVKTLRTRQMMIDLQAL